MRKGQGSGTEAEFNTLLDEIISLVGYTRDKDVFKAFYSTQLAKRLLLNKSASDDMERTMILKLQKEMGEEFTSGDVMMKDLALSETCVYQGSSSIRRANPPASSSRTNRPKRRTRISTTTREASLRTFSPSLLGRRTRCSKTGGTLSSPRSCRRRSTSLPNGTARNIRIGSCRGDGSSPPSRSRLDSRRVGTRLA
jgi:hypothetical protein